MPAVFSLSQFSRSQLNRCSSEEPIQILDRNRRGNRRESVSLASYTNGSSQEIFLDLAPNLLES